MDSSTIVCRCEEINVDEVETALKMGALEFDDIKRLTRCGMGPCQAKTCMHLVNKIIHEQTGIPMSRLNVPRMRMPLKPTRIGVLAGANDDSSIASIFEESVQEMDGDNDEG